MIDKKEFEEIRGEMRGFEERREQVIHSSRKVIQFSKQIIYSIHRNDLDNAKKLIEVIKKMMEGLPEASYDTGIRNVAVQEYVEAMCLWGFVNDKKLLTRKELDVDVENYLMGLCDLTGELVRLAVNEAIRKNKPKSLEIKDFVTELYGEFLKFDLRNGELRKKSDSIKWNLRKLEDMALEIA